MVHILKLDIEGLEDMPTPMTVIKDISVSLKTFEVDVTEVEDITRKMRRIMVVRGVPPKSMREATVRARFRVQTNLEDLKERFPEGKLLGSVPLTGEKMLHVYRENKN